MIWDKDTNCEGERDLSEILCYVSHESQWRQIFVEKIFFIYIYIMNLYSTEWVFLVFVSLWINLTVHMHKMEDLSLKFSSIIVHSAPIWEGLCWVSWCAKMQALLELNVYWGNRACELQLKLISNTKCSISVTMSCLTSMILNLLIYKIMKVVEPISDYFYENKVR